jgi:beta-propeller repeat-containing protein
MKALLLQIKRILVLVLATATSSVSLATPIICDRVPVRNNTHTKDTGLGHGTCPGGSPRASLDKERPAIEDAYGKLPLRFEPNQGQIDRQVKFVSRMKGCTVFLAPTEAVLASHPNGDVIERDGSVRHDPDVGTSTVRMKLLNANPATIIEGEDRLIGTSNYLIGNDRARWHTNIPTYRKVRYANVYPGIDLVYYGAGGQLEYDFIVAPGADPKDIAIAFDGVRDTRLDSNGNLVLSNRGGEFIQKAASIYQEIHGRKQQVIGGYVFRDDGKIGFEIEEFDRHEPLVIDPQIVYSTFLGGSGDDVANGVAVDRSGNAYIAGSTTSLNFPLRGAVQDQLNRSSSSIPDDAFVTKLNAAGTDIVYSTYIGGSYRDSANAIAVTIDGRACIAGVTDDYRNASDFPVTANKFQGAHGGALPGLNVGTARNDDAFVTMLSADGASLVYSTFFGGTETVVLPGIPNVSNGEDFALAVAVDSSNDIYIAGFTQSNDLPTRGAFQSSRRSSLNGFDSFIARFDPAKSGDASLVFASFLGGTDDDIAKGIAVDLFGNAYIAGETASADLQTKGPSGQTLPPFQGNYQGGTTDAFVAKIDTNRSGAASLVYLTYLGGANTDRANAIAVDSLERVYVTGASNSPDFPVSDSLEATDNNSDAFVTKLNADGTALFYSTFIGGSAGEEGFGIGIDSGGNAYITGVTSSNDFNVINGFPQTVGGGFVFINKLGASVSATGAPSILFSDTFGGNATQAKAIAVDSKGNVYITGRTTSAPSLQATPGAFQESYQGGASDTFLTKIGSTFPDTIGVFRPSTGQFFLRNSNTTGGADITVAVGQPGDIPVTGDWDGDGVDDAGVFRPSTGQFLLRQPRTILIAGRPTTIVTTITVNFGQAGDLPVVGDWDGDGIDTVGVFRNGVFLLRNSNTSGSADLTVTFGAAGDLPIAGDWDGDGIDTVGFFRPSAIQFQLTNTSQGVAAPDFSFFFGIATDLPVVGDFDGDGIDTVGVFRDGQFFLTNSNSNPNVALNVLVGVAGDVPVAGDWDGRPPVN